jgi:hypothetical protein
MTTDYIWQKSYRAALLETDWTKMPDRLQGAEAELRERERVLSEDHGGTEQERQAIVDAIKGLKMLQRDVVEWRKRQSPGNSTT